MTLAPVSIEHVLDYLVCPQKAHFDHKLGATHRKSLPLSFCAQIQAQYGPCEPHHDDSIDTRIQLTQTHIDRQSSEPLLDACISDSGCIASIDCLVYDHGRWVGYWYWAPTRKKRYQKERLTTLIHWVKSQGIVDEAYLVQPRLFKYRPPVQRWVPSCIHRATDESTSLGRITSSLIQACQEQLSQPLQEVGVMGQHCYQPSCPYLNRCTTQFTPDHPFFLNGVSYKQKIMDPNIELPSSLPPEIRHDFIKFGQSKCVQAILKPIRPSFKGGDLDPSAIQLYCETNQQVYVNQPQIKEWLNSLKWPIACFDFEAVQLPFRKFIGIRPYESYPITYSIHRWDQQTIEARQGQLDNQPPNEKKFIHQLIQDLEDVGSIVVYDADFEKEALRLFGRQFPQYRRQCRQISSRLVDISQLIKQGHLYLSGTKGHQSLKAIHHLFYPQHTTVLDTMVNPGRFITDLYMQCTKTGDDQRRLRLWDYIDKYGQIDTLSLLNLVMFICALDKGPSNSFQDIGPILDAASTQPSWSTLPTPQLDCLHQHPQGLVEGTT